MVNKRYCDLTLGLFKNSFAILNNNVSFVLRPVLGGHKEFTEEGHNGFAEGGHKGLKPLVIRDDSLSRKIKNPCLVINNFKLRSNL